MVSSQQPGTLALLKIISENEYKSLPSEICVKINQALQDQSDECTCLQSLFETEKQKNGAVISDLQNEMRNTKAELENVREKFIALSETNKDLAARLKSSDEKLESAEKAKRQLEQSIDELRHQRDTSTFKANSVQSQLDFKETQLVQLKSDLEHLNHELENAVQSKFQALVNQDEVEIKGKELELKEAQLDKDKSRMQKQIDILNIELDKRNNDIMELRKETNRSFLDLQTKLELKSSQLSTLQAQNDRLQSIYNEREKESTELRDKLVGQAQDEIDYRVHLEAQLNAQKALAQAHQEALEAANHKCSEFESLVYELKSKLDGNMVKYTTLEADYEELKKELEVRVEHFNQQMKAADEMLFTAKTDNLDKTLEQLSPYAAVVSKKLREGLTFTDILKLYADSQEELVTKQTIIENLQMDMSRIMDELKEVAPRIRQKSERLNQAMQVIEHITAEKEKIENSRDTLQAQYDNLKTQFEIVKRDSERNKTYVKDLSKQLCLFIKKEAEDRGIPVPITNDVSPQTGKRASLDLKSLLQSRLLTFSCIEELQQRNLELLESIRVLEKELEKSCSKLNAVQKEHSFCEEKSALEKELEEVRAQCDTQKVHMKYLMVLLRQQETDGFEYNEGFQSFTAKTRVTIEVQTDESTVQISVKDFEDLKSQLEDSKSKYEKRISELHSDKTKLLEQLRTAESEVSELKIKLRKIVAENEYKEEMISTLRHNSDLKSSQAESLEKNCQSYRESLIKNESVLTHLHEQLRANTKKLSTVEIQCDSYKREIEQLNESLRTLNSEREIYLRGKAMHSQLMSHIEEIKNQLKLSESMGKAKLESKLSETMNEVTGLRHKLQEEQSLRSSKIEMLNKNLELLRKQIDEEIDLKNQARQQLETVRQEAKTYENQISEMKSKLEEVKKITMTSSEKDKQVDQLKYDLMKITGELNESKKLVEVTKQNEKSIQEICSTFEKHNRELTVQNKTLQATHEVRVNELNKQIASLTNELKDKVKLVTSHQPSGESSKSGSVPLSANVAELNSEIERLTKELEDTRQQLKASEIEKEKALTNYSRELQLHANDSQELPQLKIQMSALKNQILTLENEKEAALLKLTQFEKEIGTKRETIEAEKLKVKQELEEFKNQNENLYKAIDELSNKTNQSLNEIENVSFTDEQLRGTENVITVIKYLRQQSSIAKMDKQNIECENRVLKSDLDMLKRKLSESNEMLNAERNKNLVNEKTLEKHSELIKKIEMMEVVSDSNRILREDRDKIQEKLDNVIKEKETFEGKIVEPLKSKINQLVQELEVRNQQVEHLKKQSEMWKKRSDELLDVSTRSNPEDIKRLTLEKETLSKQLMSERESYKNNLEELKTLRAENSNIKDRVNNLQGKVDELTIAKEELIKLRVELEQTKTELAQLTNVKVEFENIKKEQANVATKLEQTSKDVAAKDTEIDNLKKKEAQIRNIARKYKTQYEETVKSLEEKDKEKGSKEEEDKQKEEVHENLIKEKDELIVKYESEKTDLEQKLASAKQTHTQREDRMKEVLKKCREKMAAQTMEINELKKQTNQMGSSQSTVQPQPTADYEELEKTIAELREEKEKLARDHESLQQKYSILNRHYSSQTPKPSTSSSSDNLGVKTLIEPPTANIKPMAGASTSTVKHPTTTQQIQPWRETPLASIRPMCVESRTVVVPPTSAVVPQPQVDLLEPSSSHSDFMPVTSSAVRQATVLPTTQAPRDTAAESTQGEEMEPSPESDQQSSQQHSIALVLPQERQEAQIQQPQQSQQVVTASNQDEAGHSTQQYRQEVPSTSTNQQANDSNCSNTVTTSRGNVKRVRTTDVENLEEDEEDSDGVHVKRRRVLEVEYQVPTSSQRDQEDDIALEDSDEEGNGEEEEEEGDEEEEEEQEDEPDDGGEPTFEERTYEEEEQGEDFDEQNTQPSAAEPSSSQPPSYEEGGDDSIVPSTPTLFVPRRADAISSPHVPSGRFTFSDSTPASIQVSSDTMDPARLVDLTTEESGTSRSVPTTPVSISTNETFVEQAITLAPIDFSMEPPEGIPDLDQDMSGPEFVVIDITDSQSEVSSEGERQEQRLGGDVEEGREAEAMAQRIPLVSMRGANMIRGPGGMAIRGSRGRGNRIQPIVWEDPENHPGGIPRGRAIPSTDPRQFRGRAGRRGRQYPSFNRYLP